MSETLNKWVRVTNDSFDETERMILIKAWKNFDLRDKGKIIAKVSMSGKVVYLDDGAREDELAQEIIGDTQFDALAENASYPLYIADWLNVRGFKKEDGDEETGYPDGCCYVCFGEFRDAEFQDEEYMETLLSEEDFETYKEIFGL